MLGKTWHFHPSWGNPLSSPIHEKPGKLSGVEGLDRGNLPKRLARYSWPKAKGKHDFFNQFPSI